MKYKVECTYWQLLKLNEALGNMSLLYCHELGSNTKMVSIVEHLARLNYKFLKKLLKNFNAPGGVTGFGISYVDLVAIKAVFTMLDFDDRCMDSLMIKGKLHQLLVSM